MAVGEAHPPVGVEQLGRPRQRPGCQPVIGREQDGIVTIRPFKQALVVGGDIALVHRVGRDLDPGILLGNGLGNLNAVVGRGVVDNEYTYFYAILAGKHAVCGITKEMSVVVARNDNADRTQAPAPPDRLPPASWPGYLTVLPHGSVCRDTLGKTRHG